MRGHDHVTLGWRHTPAIRPLVVVASVMLAASVPSPVAAGAEADDDRGERVRIGPTATRVDPSRRILLVAGSIGGCAWSGDSSTASLIASRRGLVMTGGDHAFQRGSRRQFRACYGPTWGRFRDRTRPVPGDRDHATAGGAGYFGYFGRRAGPVGRGYYAFDYGAWRVYALDTECQRAGCRKGSAQHRWLATDLATHPTHCVLTVMHRPLFSSGPSGDSDATRPLVALLYRSGAEVIVNGHDRIYERLAPARPRGTIDREEGIRQFIVGTGGAPLHGFGSRRPPHSRVRQDSAHGILKLVLRADGYTWRYIPVSGAFTDRGRSRCHESPDAFAEPGRTVG
ncbi:hypothetical protein BH23CHL8_BH23CHL8_07480 [soil metagenome]